MSNYWIDHLSQTLSEQDMIAYIWYIDEDRIEWAGDMVSAFGLEERDFPSSHASFNSLINPQHVPERLAAVHEAVSRHVTERRDAAFTLRYQLRNNNGDYLDIKEKSLIHQDEKSGSRILCGTLYLCDKNKNGRDTDHGANVTNIENIKNNAGRHIGNYSEDRSGLMRKISDLISSGKTPHYILSIGLDRTGMMNETFGAAFTDDYILKSWEKLRRVIGGSKEVHRIDGDVFAVCVSGAGTLPVEICAQKILTAFRDEPLRTEQGLYSVSVSVGSVAFDMADHKDPATMITQAEITMRLAKEKGRGCFASYTEVVHDMDENRNSSAAADTLLSAFYDGRIQLAYQPVMMTKNNKNYSKNDKPSFYECFMRFFDEKGRGHSAGDFVPALERLGMISMIDKYVANMVIMELETFSDITLAVNVSARTLSDDQWLDEVMGKLAGRNSVAKRFIVEVTETAAVDNIAQARKVIKTLQSAGIRVALDDFGAGYTSFSQLKALDVDLVKIDKAFIHGLSKKENRLFIHALQTLAQGMDMKTVAEGAESLEDIRILKDYGIDYIQGYIYGYPGVERIWLPENHSHRFVPSNFKNAARLAAKGENCGGLYSISDRTSAASGF